jgi:hypothetical protein
MFYEDDEEKTVTVSKPGTVAIEESRVMSEVKAQVFMARQYPRDVISARDRILSECDRLKLAEKAIYSFPRGGTQVTGPSIRLAEALGRAWGNIDAGIIEGERTEGESSIIAYAWDLETNLRIRKEFKVAHVRDTRKGRQKLTDERDIYEMTANQGSRRLRACILALIPVDIIEEAVGRCEKTLVAKVGDIATVIPKMLEKFGKIGVTKAMIEARLRHRIDATQAAEVVQLGNVYNSISDGMATVADYFDAPDTRDPEDILAPQDGLESNAHELKPARASSKKLADIKLALIDYGDCDETPETIKGDIEAALKANPEDQVILGALLAKVKAAVDRRPE